MRTYAITIGGASKAIQSGWGITETANGRNRMDCAVLSMDGSYRAAIESEVICSEDGTRIFGSLIDRPVETNAPRGNGSPALVMRVSAVDFNVYASRITLTADIAAGTLKAALTVVATALSAQGVTLAAGQVTGPSLPALSYIDRLIQDVLDEICTLASGSGATSWVWNIDYSKVLSGTEAGTEPAPFDITDGDGNVNGDMTVEQARSSDYANYVILYGGEGQLEIDFEPHNGNGVTRTFVLNAPVAVSRHLDGSPDNVLLVGALRIDGGAGGYPVGVYGVDDMPWTFDAAANAIRQRSDQTLIAVGHYIEMSYIGQFPVRVVADGGASAANRVMKIYTAPAVFDVAVMQALADSYVVRDMASPKTVRYSAAYDKTGLHPGQVQTITSTKRNLSGTHLITDVQIRHVGGQLVQRQVTAVSTTRLPATLRETFRRVFGGSSSGSTVASSVGSVTIVTGDVAIWFLGGSLTEWVQSSGPTWIPATSVQVQINTAQRGGSLEGTCRVRLRASAGSVTARLRDVTTGVTAGTSAAVTDTAYQTVSFPVSLTAGANVYEIQVLPGLADTDVNLGSAYVE